MSELEKLEERIRECVYAYVFPDSEAVNRALRDYVAGKQKAN